MDDNQFYLTIWSLVFLAALSLATIISVSMYNEDILMHDLVQQGHDPMEIKCLFDLSDTNETACLFLTQAKIDMKKAQSK